MIQPRLAVILPSYMPRDEYNQLQLRPLPIAIALCLLTVLVYIPSIFNGFIWDDPQYVVDNPMLKSPDGLWRIWTDPSATPQYYPLVHTTFWIEAQLWGTHNAAGFHIDNILLHAVAVVLLWRALIAVGVPWPALGAAIFAVHPVMVESVAWVTERKNVLSLALYLWAFHAYRRGGLRRLNKTPDVHGGPRRQRWYWASLALFIFALLSKTVTCSLPAAILLIIFWRRGKLKWIDVVPLLPMFIIGALLAGFTGHLERTHVGARGPDFNWSMVDRCLIAGHAICFYAAKLILPHPLMFMYPRWDLHTDRGWQFIYPVIVIAIVVGVWASRRRQGRGPLVAVLFFIGTLTPALGFVNVYPMRYSFVADHFQYLASIGVIALISGGIGKLYGVGSLAPKEKKRDSDRHSSQLMQKRPPCDKSAKEETGKTVQRLNLFAASPAFWTSAIVLLPLICLTIHQQSIYKDQLTLWQNTIAQNETCWMAHVNLAGVYGREGQMDLSLKESERALQLAPNVADTQYNMGVAMAERRRWQEAADRFVLAVKNDPECSQAWSYLARLLWEHFDTQQAKIQAYVDAQKAMKINPNLADTHYVLARVAEYRGDFPGAVAEYNRALALNPDDFHAHYNLGTCLLQSGDPGDAAGEFQKVLAHDRNDAPSLANLGYANLMVGRRSEAVGYFKQALTVDPNLAPAREGLRRAAQR